MYNYIILLKSQGYLCLGSQSHSYKEQKSKATRFIKGQLGLIIARLLENDDADAVSEDMRIIRVKAKK